MIDCSNEASPSYLHNASLNNFHYKFSLWLQLAGSPGQVIYQWLGIESEIFKTLFKTRQSSLHILFGHRLTGHHRSSRYVTRRDRERTTEEAPTSRHVIDSHVFIWIKSHDRVSKNIRRIYLRPASDCFEPSYCIGGPSISAD